MYIVTLINNLIFNRTNKDAMFAVYNQQDSTFHNLYISVRHSSFRQLFHPSSGAQNGTYSARHLSDQYYYLLLAAGSSIGLKQVDRLPEINKL